MLGLLWSHLLTVLRRNSSVMSEVVPPESKPADPTPLVAPEAADEPAKRKKLEQPAVPYQRRLRMFMSMLDDFLEDAAYEEVGAEFVGHVEHLLNKHFHPAEKFVIDRKLLKIKLRSGLAEDAAADNMAQWIEVTKYEYKPLA